MMKRMKTLARVVLTILVLLTCLTGASWGAAISGFVNYSGNQTGRVHLMLAQPDPYMGGASSPTGIGTSIRIASAGKQQVAYTLQGVPTGSSYELIAFMDTATPPTGYANGASPIGKTGTLPEITSQSQTLTEINVNIGPQVRNPSTDPNPWPLPVDPSNGHLTADTFSNGFAINWRGPENSYGIEIADSYDIYWSTDPLVGPGVTTGGGQVLGKKAIYDNNFYIVTGLTNGTNYYVAIVARLGGASSSITRTGAIVPTAPTGNGTITGTLNIDFGTTPAGRNLYVIADNNITNKMFAAPIMAGAATQTYTISNLEPGTYSIHTLYDVDNSHFINDGDLINKDQRVMITIPLTGGTFTAPLIKIKGANSTPRVVTNMSPAPKGVNYDLQFYVDGQLKHPAHIEFSGGPNVGATSIGIGRWSEFGYHWSIPRPTIGDQYSGTITYTDNSTESFTVEVTGLINAIPLSSYPNGQISGNTRSNPTLSWRPSDIPQGDYKYYVSLSDYSITNGDNEIWSAVADNDVLTATYSGTALVDTHNYNWNVTISDSYGNSASSSYSFMPVASGPTISSISPAGTAAVGTPGLSITGTGFDSATPSNNVVSFNSFGATVTSATPTQLTVNMPTGAATGLVSVRVNNVTTASAAEFVPTATYDSFIVDKNNSGLANVTAKRFKSNDKVNPLQTLPLTTTSGNYKFTGIHTAKPYFQTFTPADSATYVPTFTPRMVAFGNVSSAGPADKTFSIYDKARIATWGSNNNPPLAQQAGKALVRTRVAYSNNNGISGAVVRAFSTKYGTTGHYPVYYSTSDETILTTTSTTDNGAFYILNVDPDDVLVITASISGMQFNVRTYDMAADIASQGRLTGTPLPTISGFTPTSATPGSTVTINGTNFSTNPASNSVCFGSQCTNPSAATATQLTVTVPCGSQIGPITVITNNNSATSSGSFNIPAPSITSIFPMQGPPNTNVTINGTNFSVNGTNSFGCPGEQVKFNDSTAFNVIWNTTNQITAYVPFFNTAAGPVNVTTSVVTGGGTANGPTFTVLPFPSVSSHGPDFGPIGTQITLTGSFYDLTPSLYNVQVDGFAATVISVTANALVFIVPNNIQNFASWTIEYYNQQFWSGSFTVTPKLTVAISGSGSGSVNSNPSGTSCSGAWCRTYNYNTPITLTASPSVGSDPGVWGGDCGSGPTSIPCNLTMNANKTVTATFLVQDNARLDNGTTPYATVLEAYNAATVAGTVIKLRDKAFTEALNADNGTTVTLSGGYAAGFGATHTGVTSITGLIISLGSLTIDNLTIR